MPATLVVRDYVYHRFKLKDGSMLWYKGRVAAVNEEGSHCTVLFADGDIADKMSKRVLAISVPVGEAEYEGNADFI